MTTTEQNILKELTEASVGGLYKLNGSGGKYNAYAIRITSIDCVVYKPIIFSRRGINADWIKISKKILPLN